MPTYAHQSCEKHIHVNCDLLRCYILLCIENNYTFSYPRFYYTFSYPRVLLHVLLPTVLLYVLLPTVLLYVLLPTGFTIHPPTHGFTIRSPTHGFYYMSSYPRVLLHVLLPTGFVEKKIVKTKRIVTIATDEVINRLQRCFALF